MNKGFTYENFETNGILTILDPLFTSIAIFSVLLLLTLRLFIPPAKLMLIVGAFTIIIAGQLFIINGILADELDLARSSKVTVLFGLTVALQLLVIGLTFWKEKKNKQS